MFNDEQKEALNAPLNTGAVKQRRQGGGQVSYIEGWHAIAEANRIFGHGMWTRETVEMREVRTPEEVDGKWRVGFACKCRVTVHGEGESVREGWGYGSGIAKDLGEAYESAVKEAETDAMKRALMTFGNPFGLALYDKDQRNVSDAPPRKSAAQAKRDGDYDRIIALIDAAETLDQLKAAWRKVYPEFETLPASWEEPFTDRKDQRKAELEGSADAPLDPETWLSGFGDRVTACKSADDLNDLNESVSQVLVQYPDNIQKRANELVLDAAKSLTLEPA